jgi:hypothetical protein
MCATACSASPSQDLLGSYFPAWMLCASIGIVAAIVCHVILVAIRLNKHVLMPPLGYIAVAVAVTLFSWLYRFGQ